MEQGRRKIQITKEKTSRKPWIVCAVIACFLVFGLLRMIIVHSAACTYIMTDGDRHETVRLYPGSVEEACNKAGFRNVEVVYQKEEDGVVYLTLEETIDVSIQTSEEALTVRAVPCTVGELLEENGITVGSNDIVTPDVDTWISENSQITVTRVTFSTVTETESIPFSIDVEYDSQMLKGEQKVTQYGANGEKEVQYRVEEHDGEEVAREVTSEKEIKQPVNCIVKQGIGIAKKTQNVQAASSNATNSSSSSEKLPASQTDSQNTGELSTAGRSQVWSVPAGITDDTENKIITAGDGSSYEYTAVIDVTATAYHRVEDGGEITASGTVTKYGTIAVDPRVIPLGSRLYVVSDGGDQSWSYGPGLAEDTGGLIKGTKIDLFFMTGDEADDFGIRPAKVYILKD